MNISQRITQARLKAGLSPQELAQAIQVSEDDVLRWESGLASPDAVQLAALCRQFQVTSDYLLFGTQPQPPACPGCGAPIQEDSSFCPKCGRRLSGSIPGYALVLEHPLYSDVSIEALYQLCRESSLTPASRSPPAIPGRTSAPWPPTPPKFSSGGSLWSRPAPFPQNLCSPITCASTRTPRGTPPSPSSWNSPPSPLLLPQKARRRKSRA